MRKASFYYILLLLLCSSFLLKAQAPTDTVYAEEAEEEYTDEDTVAPVHYLWDQELAIDADTMSDYYSGRLILRKVPGKVMDEMRADKAMKYKLSRKKETERSDLTWLENIYLAFLQLFGIFHRLILALLIGGLITATYTYLKRNGYISTKKEAATGTDIKLTDEDLEITVYEQQITDAIAQGKYRLAVRLLYLQTLRLLSDKQIITYSREKTNAAYLRSMISTPWYKAFAGLTLDYEYIWYGERPVSSEQFKTVHNQFSQFMNELGYTR
ncbi:DUF4129 domain-containing protein [Chitinophaga tropicalis]|uniref:DUF4129 domain-containing protein n=1 Tax=Chitinophaga tropicalis TaxID=2683588 RepID=A0A7K1U975_9BACT|nr:DUF4129 domain-containing protein [Chitinophaga tropicalis]MVT10921.1 DUF4129 domain-containing protein [Chitinophaga tropicalis]